MLDRTDDATASTSTERLTGSDPVGVAFADIESALTSVADQPAWRLSEEVVQARFAEVLRIRSAVEELTARLLASVVERELPRLAGASSPRSWLMNRHRVSTRDATRLLAEATMHQPGQVGRVAATRDAWAAGEVTAEQAVLIAGTISRVDIDVATAATNALQGDLIKLTPALTFVQLQHACRHAFEVIDPDGADARLEQQLLADEERALQLTQFRARAVGDGTTRGSFRIPDVQYAMLRRALDAFTSPRHFRSDQQTPAAGDPATDPTKLTHAQRLGRAFLELIEHLPIDGMPQHGVANATIVVTMTLDQLLGGLGESVLDNGTVISNGQSRRLACNARLIPMVLGGPSKILDAGLGQRLYDRYQRLALAVRDKGCIFVGCDRSPSFCEAHHIRRWSLGGPTDLSNGCLLCPFHHHLVHVGEWAIQMASDGVPEVIPPGRVDPSQSPIRHQRFKHRFLC